MERTPTFFSSGLMALEHLVEGNYIEIQEVDLSRKKVRRFLLTRPPIRDSRTLHCLKKIEFGNIETNVLRKI